MEENEGIGEDLTDLFAEVRAKEVERIRYIPENERTIAQKLDYAISRVEFKAIKRFTGTIDIHVPYDLRTPYGMAMANKWMIDAYRSPDDPGGLPCSR